MRIGIFVAEMTRRLQLVQRSKRRRGVPLGMHRMNPEYLDPDSFDGSATADILLRQEPDEDEDEEEEDEDEGDDKEEGDDEETCDGYSE